MTGHLRDQLADYLTLRRSLGYRLERPEKLLRQFLGHLEDRGEPILTVDSALAWAQLPADASVNWWAYRLCVVRVSIWRSESHPFWTLSATGYWV
ncbi:hypothetical protein GA0111570_102195 [Raineyella antarctica]|uniref:Uncharacterized protein n=1 Tax=Raineyella antarctica TaxID=1577474 RepID=A0A1G6GF80_9ACTN|nr:hypothetical protein [Raineyella antarctica]SDB80405.1 hypothetical protein GA0111570_102195 [Raineyella antarctica]